MAETSQSGSRMSDPLFIDAVPKNLPVMGIDTKIHKAKIKDFGEFSYATEDITLQWKLPYRPAKMTLIHELVHGGFLRSGLHEKLNDMEMEESICRMMETLFYPLVDFKFEKK